jgi:tol-pal system protein YbgF
MELTNRQDKADLTAQVDEVRQKLDALQNLLQDTNYRISDLNQRSPSRDIFQPNDRNTSTPGDSSATPQVFPVDSARELYNTAYRDLIRGNYQLALSGFRQFVRQHPNSDLIGKAQYWIGEVFYSQGRYSNAIEEFEKFVRRYRNHPKKATALLKIGYAYFNIDEIEQGKIYLEEVVQQHPDSEEANLAKGRLASLNE